MTLRILFALACGILLRFVVGLEPIWWMAWIVLPALLWSVLQAEGRWWKAILLAGLLVGFQANAILFFRVTSAPIAALFLAGQVLLWSFVLSETRRVVLKAKRAWTICAYPVIWVAVDTLLAAFSPDGNWASLAYSQADFLPIMQVAALFGVGGVLFLLSLFASAVAVTATLGLHKRENRLALFSAITVVAVAVGFGLLRLQGTHPQPTLPVGLAAVDDAIGLQAKTPYIAPIQDAYDAHVAALARAGAKLVLLPEKIAVVEAADAANWSHRFGQAALRNKVWLVAGIAVKQDAGIANEAWLFSPTGERDATYQKRFLAPPERADYLASNTPVVRKVEGLPFGLAICKDMHFATLGQDYGKLAPASMLVPAWDFWVDRWMGARMTATRGIENGYTVVRSSREGLLTVSDAYGRIVAEMESGPMPGTRLLANAPIGGAIPTLYTRIGNAFGWLCVLAMVGLLWFSRRG